ncbi:hypothetical protein ACSBR1_015810 [Camellia fascicularis]
MKSIIPKKKKLALISSLLVLSLVLSSLILCRSGATDDNTGMDGTASNVQLQNQESLYRQPVKLIFWMMATDGRSMARKWLKEILIQGNTFTQLGLLIYCNGEIVCYDRMSKCFSTVLLVASYNVILGHFLKPFDKTCTH